MTAHTGWMLPLFVPAIRPDRFARAAASGADAIILDLEDAVAPEDKKAARANVEAAAEIGVDVILRINAVGTSWHDDDLLTARFDVVAAVMLPKTELSAQVSDVHSATAKPILPLIETAAALGSIRSIAESRGVVQIALGTQDLASELGCSPKSRLFDPIRLELLIAAHHAGIRSPLDGVSLDIDDEEQMMREASEIAATGFAGRLLIHPRQVAPSIRGLTPSSAEIANAERIVASEHAASKVDGRMVDRPVRANAEQLLQRARRFPLQKWTA